MGDNTHKTDNTIFIERKKKRSFVQTLNEYFEVIKGQILINQYKSEKIVWKVLYDKIYRNDLFSILISADEKESAFLRSLYYVKQENGNFPLLKDNIELDNDDLDIFYENNYLLNSHKFYLIETYSYFLYIPLLAISLFFKFRGAQKKFNFTTFVFISILGLNFFSTKQRRNFYDPKQEKKLIENNEKAITVYKKLFYIDI
jgi:hypothetical protein